MTLCQSDVGLGRPVHGIGFADDGLGITDACIGWAETETLLERIAGAMRL